jgi:hypothetical protein
MRKLKGSGSYLKNQTRKNLAKAILSLALFGLIFSAASYRIIQNWSIGVLEIAGFLVSLIPLAGFLFYQRKYRIYKGGSQGEKNVIKTLTQNLNDDYSLINEVCLPSGGGDIDHIVLGPNGVFVLETKNWSGRIIIDSDQWHRPGKHAMGSPSLQAKRNAQKLKRLIDAAPSLRALNIWVEGIVVLTNRHANVSINSPTVPILKLQQLTNHITNHTGNQLTQEQIRQIAKQIQNA